MVKIRLARGGVKNRPFYRIVIADSRSSRDGKFIERVGFFNSIGSYFDNRDMFIDLDRVNFWVQRGAEPSKRVSNLIKLYKKRR